MKVIEQKENYLGKRAFLKSGFRFLMLGAIIVICGIFGRKKNPSGSEKSLCVIDTPCRNCPKSASCRDSRAIESKRDVR